MSEKRERERWGGERSGEGVREFFGHPAHESDPLNPLNDKHVSVSLILGVCSVRRGSLRVCVCACVCARVWCYLRCKACAFVIESVTPCDGDGGVDNIRRDTLPTNRVIHREGERRGHASSSRTETLSVDLTSLSTLRSLCYNPRFPGFTYPPLMHIVSSFTSPATSSPQLNAYLSI